MSTNKQDFENNVKPMALQIDKAFNSQHLGFNSDGGIGYMLSLENKDTTYDYIFIWYEDKQKNMIDVTDFKLENISDYTLCIHVQIEDMSKDCIFDNPSDAVQYYTTHK